MGNHPLRGVHAPTRGHREHERESRQRRDWWVSAGVEDKVNPCDFRSAPVEAGAQETAATLSPVEKPPAVLTEVQTVPVRATFTVCSIAPVFQVGASLYNKFL